MQKRYITNWGSYQPPREVTGGVEERFSVGHPDAAILSCPSCHGQIEMAVYQEADNLQSRPRLVGGMRAAFLTFLSVVLLGCGATRSSFVPSGGYVPRPPTQEVLVYFEGAPPPQPYDVIGVVYAEKEANTAGRWDVVQPEAVIALLKAKAQTIGADAIIDVRVMTLTDRRRDYKKGEAKAIVFKKP